jgi:AraC-like DNA-binding protein
MTFTVNSNEVAEGDRAEWVHEIFASRIVPVEITWPQHRRGVSAQGAVSPLGGDLMVCLGRTSALKLERTLTLARDAMQPCIFTLVQLTGSRLVVQDGREAVLQPGDVAIYDSTAPYSLLSDSGVSGAFFRIPHDALAMPHNMIRKACAISLSPGHPVTSLTSDYIRRLATDPELSTSANAGLIAHPSIELVRAVIAIHLEADQLAGGSLAATMQLRILEYARRHLYDPGLCAEQIAAANYISVRYLYKVLAESGVSLADWIRTQRLRACRQELAKACSATTIGAIAKQHGFSNTSSFSRAFRAEYGVSAREWRDRHSSRDSRRDCETPIDPASAVRPQ